MAVAHVPLDDEARERFEARVTAAARRFELKPLLDLLLAKGYTREQILFQSVLEGSSIALIDAVHFRRKPIPGVVLSLNLGLLSNNTLLPSYFFEQMEKVSNPEPFYEFIRFFDHRLIENYRRALYPEDDHGVYRNWNQVLRSFFRMLGPGSVSTLHWLAQLYFPELGVRVARWTFSDSPEAHAFRTGESKLDGTGIIGRKYQADAQGFSLDIFAEEETDARGRAWPNLVRLRLNESLLPLLAPFNIPLIVRLKVLFHTSWVRVDMPFASEHGYLGYERIHGDAEGGHTTLLYRGITGKKPRA